MRALAVAALVVVVLSSSRAGGAAAEPVEPGPMETPAGAPERISWEVVSRRPHDTDAWTQGLVLDEAGRLFESTGQVGRTTLREVDPVSGTVLRAVAPPDPVFGEGLALVDGRPVQLTWRDGIAYEWDAETFELLRSFPYEGEGWGLCFDGSRLVMSDGSERLTFRDPATFEPLGWVEAEPVGDLPIRLNELECADGSVWANAYDTDLILRIDPADGTVTGVLDATGLLEPHPATRTSGAVLNGIAADRAAGTLLLTGKLWPEVIEVRIVEDGPEPPGHE
jgi:glutaminyl-peptide cyclotransferase